MAEKISVTIIKVNTKGEEREDAKFPARKGLTIKEILQGYYGESTQYMYDWSLPSEYVPNADLIIKLTFKFKKPPTKSS